MDMVEKLRQVETQRERLRLGGGSSQVDTQHQRGKLTARERIERLVDPGTFQELDLWVQPAKTGFEVDQKEIPGDAIIVGYGEVDKRPIHLLAQDFTVLAGSYGAVNWRKWAASMEKSLTAMVPSIRMIDSSGYRVQDQFGIGGGDALYRDCSGIMCMPPLSSGIIPQISLVMGPCVAGSAYSPMMSDFLLMVKNTSYLYVAGPPMVKAALHLDVTEEEVGGAMMHAEVSGTCDVVAENDDDCLQKAKELLSFLPTNYLHKPAVVDTGDDPNRRDESLLQIVPLDPSQPYDIHDVIGRVVDNGEFYEIKALYATNIVVGFARLAGKTVGIVANNPAVLGGAIDINACDKEARFVRFCDAFNIPLVFLADTPGFLSSIEQEQRGLVRHGAKAVYALAEASVPKITIYVRNCGGGGHLVMGDEHIGCDLTIAWPSAQRGSLNPEQAVDIIYRKEIESSRRPEEVRQRRLKEFRESYGLFPFHAGALQLIEDIIDPRETRPVLVGALRMLEEKKEERPPRKHDNMPL